MYLRREGGWVGRVRDRERAVGVLLAVVERKGKGSREASG